VLKTLLNRRARPQPGHAHDHLFADLAPGSANASARLLSVLYEQYAGVEAPTPQYAHFRKLVKAIVGDDQPRRLRGLGGAKLQRVRAAYVCCFEPHEQYVRQLAAWWTDPAFLAQLLRAREHVVKELEAHVAAEAAQRAYLARLTECRATPIDLDGETLLEQIKQMRPDDWHEIVLNWNWDHGVTELEWITSQPTCDRATAVYAYGIGEPARIATRWQKPTYEAGRWDYGGFVRAVAARLEGGFYINAEIGLDLPASARDRFEREIAQARATGENPWQLPEGLVSHSGRAHAPRYTLSRGAAHYHYAYWLAHVARPTC
jgi:hypothetical protein